MSRHLVDDQLGQGTHTTSDTTEPSVIHRKEEAPAPFTANRFHEEEIVGHPHEAARKTSSGSPPNRRRLPPTLRRLPSR